VVVAGRVDCLSGVRRGTRTVLFFTVMRFETLALMEASSWVVVGLAA
jgi:hypothetical protein